MGCTELRELALGDNSFMGSLEPLRGCARLQKLYLTNNQLTGGVEPLHGCKVLQGLSLSGNELSAGFETLRGCTALRKLYLAHNHNQGNVYLGKLNRIHPLVILLARKAQARRDHLHTLLHLLQRHRSGLIAESSTLNPCSRGRG